MYDDFVFKRFPLAKVIFLRAPMPKWLFMPTEHAETCYLRLTKHFLFQNVFASSSVTVKFATSIVFIFQDQRACFMDFSTHWDVFWTVTYSVIAIVITVSNSATIVIFYS